MSVRKVPGVQDLQRSIGDRIRLLRQRKGWSQEEFAALCGLHRTCMGHVERGEKNLSLSTMIRISDGLGIAPTELFRLTPKGSKDPVAVQGRRNEHLTPAAMLRLIKEFRSERQVLSKTVDSLVEVERKLRRVVIKKGKQPFEPRGSLQNRPTDQASWTTLFYPIGRRSGNFVLCR